MFMSNCRDCIGLMVPALISTANCFSNDSINNLGLTPSFWPCSISLSGLLATSVMMKRARSGCLSSIVISWSISSLIFSSKGLSELKILNIPPKKSLTTAGLVIMMIVMPAFAQRQESQDEIIPAGVVCIKPPFSNEMRGRINEKRGMP